MSAAGASMKKTPNRLFMLIASLGTAFMLQAAHAEPAPVSMLAPHPFIIQLPDVDREVLADQVRLLRSQLIQRKQVLVESVADRKLDGGDALITIIMPGGLLYAGFKKARYEQAKNELARVSADIDEFSSDLLAVQSWSAPVMVALHDAGFDPSCHLVPAGESSKCLEQTENLCRSLAEAGHDRRSFVVALGGGVVGDLAGFAAAVFYRGIPLVQIPTTIVSQVDSSIGGKTGVNIPEGKNLVGSFHQPRLVLVDPDSLATLPDREFREGIAEVIKHAAIRDAAMLDDIAALDPDSRDVPADLISRNLAIKARIVEEDEHETAGTRALCFFVDSSRSETIACMFSASRVRTLSCSSGGKNETSRLIVEDTSLV